MAQVIENKRRLPTQQRAADTVDAILEAAAQILQKEGEEGLNTNRIAERAGFSIGTLYQYFPNKDAVLAALVQREREAIVAGIVKAIAERKPGRMEDVLRVIVRTLVTAFARRRRARKIIVLAMLRRWQIAPAQEGADQIARMMVAMTAARSEGVAPLSPAGAFVLTRAVLGAIRAAVLEESPLLETQEFEDEVVRLARAYLMDRDAQLLHSPGE